MVYLKRTHLLESVQVLGPKTDELTERGAFGLIELRALIALVALCDVAELFGRGLLLRLIDFYCLVDALYRLREDLVLINNADLVVLDSLADLQRICPHHASQTI